MPLVTSEDAKTKDRGPNFPFISLEKSIERAQEFHEQEKRGSAPPSRAARHWHYSINSSGLSQTMAALKSYGLLTDNGIGDERKIQLTELALRILLDKRPDSQERGQFLRQAALTPPVVQTIYKQWPDGLPPSEATINHFLTLELGFNANTAEKATKILINNESFTMLHGSDTISDVISAGEEIMQPSGAEKSRTISLSSLRGGAPLANVERITGPTGDIVVQFVGQRTFEAYQFLEDYIKLRKGILKGAAGGKEEGKKENQT